jgi:hypothetical protein
MVRPFLKICNGFATTVAQKAPKYSKIRQMQQVSSSIFWKEKFPQSLAALRESAGGRYRT